MFEVVDGVVQVSDEHIREAVRLVLRDAGLVLEPSGAVGIAAILAHPAAFRALRVGCILSGGKVPLRKRCASRAHKNCDMCMNAGRGACLPGTVRAGYDEVMRS